MTRRKPSDKSKPWLLIIEFPCHGDAFAAKELLSNLLPEEISLRRKYFHPSDGNIAAWRSTAVLRAELKERSFRQADVEKALQEANYNDEGHTWIHRAHKYGVIERLEKGLYRFLPAELPAPSVGQGGEALRTNGLDLHIQYSHASDFTEHMEVLHCVGCTPAPLAIMEKQRLIDHLPRCNCGHLFEICYHPNCPEGQP